MNARLMLNLGIFSRSHSTASTAVSSDSETETTEEADISKKLMFDLDSQFLPTEYVEEGAERSLGAPTFFIDDDLVQKQIRYLQQE